MTEEYQPLTCESCLLRKKKTYGFGWVEYECGHIETFNPTEW